MTPRTLQRVRRGLLGLVVLVSGAVVWSLRRPPAPPAPAPAAGTAAPAPGTVRLGGFTIRQLKEGRESFVLRAETMSGQEQQEVRLTGVHMTFPYTARGVVQEATVTSEHCTYTAPQQKAVFRGAVQVRTQDGVELDTASLVYRGDRGNARTQDPVRFRRKAVSGTAVGAAYGGENGRIELLDEVFVRIDEEGAPPVEVRSRRAVLESDDGILRFKDRVEARRGPDVLTADLLLVTFTTEDRLLAGFLAAGNSELRTSGEATLPGAALPAAGRGPRILKGRRLDVVFRTDRPERTLKVATAGPDADLLLLPAPGEPRERRRLKARFLTFRFDEEGRLSELEGMRDVDLTTEPLPPSEQQPLELKCRGFTAKMDTAKDTVRNVDFRRDVEITQGTRRGAGDSGWYEGATGLLTLRIRPRLVDTADGSRLTAAMIQLDTRSGDVSALQDVQHSLGRSSTTRSLGFGGDSETPTLVLAGRFAYTTADRTSRYHDGAVLRSGKDEVRAPEIRLSQDPAGRGRFSAAGGVTSLFHPREAASGRPPSPVEARAQRMDHQEGTRRIHYAGDVVIRQGDIESKSPAATVHLREDREAVEKLVAGEPVEIRQGPKSATGRHATYTLSDETLLLVGDTVVLKDPVQGEVRGRSLTFRVGDDSFRMDGREEGRTEMILQQEPPRP